MSSFSSTKKSKKTGIEKLGEVIQGLSAGMVVAFGIPQGQSAEAQERLTPSEKALRLFQLEHQDFNMDEKLYICEVLENESEARSFLNFESVIHGAWVLRQCELRTIDP